MPGLDQGQNSWTEYRKLILDTLENLREEHKEIKETLSSEVKENRKDLDEKVEKIHRRINQFELQLTVDITTLKAKSAILGGVFGALIGAIVSALIGVLFQKFHL